RRYLPRSNVLETTFRCDGGGVLRLTDCMPLPGEPTGEMQTARELDPEHEVLRRLECTAGEVDVEIEFAPRPGYGARRTGFRDCGKLGWQLTGCPFGAFLQTDIPLRSDSAILRGSARLRAGDVRWCSFAYDQAEASVLPPLGEWAQRRLEDTAGWWRWWTGRCHYEGEYGEQVLRSALALKMLASATSGAVLAAPTTSLPEALGGERNWDYRFCWIRDSALVLHAFLSLGFVEEGEGFLGWLLHATRLTWPRLQVMYDLYGETRLKEKEVGHLCGYRDSRPVRIGNAAHEQLQLDIYGELIATVAQYVDAGGELDGTERRMVRGLGRSVCQLWRQPDHGIWETRGPPRHHTYSKGMCWVALDRLLRLGLGDDQMERERGAIRAQIEQHGFNQRLDGYVGYYDGEDPDAALLLLARHGYQPPAHPRMQGTWNLIRERLSRDGLLQRYPLDTGYDGVRGGENAFAPCTFWAAEYLANLGRRDEAREIFERLLGCANDVGLYAEEIVPESGEPIGNFPQAFSHVSMISAATALTVEKTA
ncbi:MAG TPA: glycoside hydrolase family 15 protein, partial [Burkholderiales bacterium]|nr:glycoside hydrolase family 15 protein [Burkholderiales bacterium]